MAVHSQHDLSGTVADMIHPMQTGQGVNISVTLRLPDKFDTPRCALLFHGGRVAPPPEAGVAPNGVWIVQPSHNVTVDCHGRGHPTQAWPLVASKKDNKALLSVHKGDDEE